MHSLIEIDYPGVNNFTQFSYDGLWRNTKIVETTAGSVTSTRQFIVTASSKREERDAANSATSRFYNLGQTINGTNYFYAESHLGSISEMTDVSGTVQAQYAFDSYGRMTKLKGSLDSDFQYDGYYAHTRSALNLTQFRGYSSIIARWITRDPIQEMGGLNLYSYVQNLPNSRRDNLGLRTYGNYKKTNYQEAMDDFCRVGGTATAIGRYLATNAQNAAQSSGFSGPIGGPQDAYRHCLWSCWMASNPFVGPEKGQAIGDCHERMGQQMGASNQETEMDTANNEAGRNAAKCPGDCEDKCSDLLKSGQLSWYGPWAPP